MERWQKVFREGFAPQLSTQGLRALREALDTDDVRLIQGRTVTPHWILGATEAPACGCPIAFAAWHGEGLVTAGQVGSAFCKIVERVENAIDFINWVDITPRSEMVANLLAEVQRTLFARDREPAPELQGAQA